jgi:WD40 repeat protein
LYPHSRRITSLLELENGDLVTGSEDGCIKVWNIRSGEIARTIDTQKKWLFHLLLLANGEIAFAHYLSIRYGAISNVLRGVEIFIWNLKSDATRSLTTIQGEMKSMISLQSNKLACLSHSGEINILNSINGRTLVRFSVDKCASCILELPNNRLAVGMASDNMHIYSLNTGREIKRNYCPGGASSLLLLDKSKMASASNNKIQIWDLTLAGGCNVFTTLTCEFNEIVDSDDLQGRKTRPQQLALLNNGVLASVSEHDSSISLWNWKSGHLISTIECEPRLKIYRSIALKKSGYLLVSGFNRCATLSRANNWTLEMHEKRLGSIQIWDFNV